MTGTTTAIFSVYLSGKGIFERDGISSPLLPGTAFFSLIPEKADIICRKRNRIIAGSISMSISRVLPPCLFFRKNQGQLPYLLSLPSDSVPVQMWLNLHEDMGEGAAAAAV